MLIHSFVHVLSGFVRQRRRYEMFRKVIYMMKKKTVDGDGVMTKDDAFHSNKKAEQKKWIAKCFFFVCHFSHSWRKGN